MHSYKHLIYIFRLVLTRERTLICYRPIQPSNVFYIVFFVTPAFRSTLVYLLFPTVRSCNTLSLGDKIFYFLKALIFETLSSAHKMCLSLLPPFVCPNDRTISWFLSDTDAGTLIRFFFSPFFFFFFSFFLLSSMSFPFGSYSRMRDYKEKMCS